MYQFIVYLDAKRQWRWRLLKEGMTEIIRSEDGYPDRDGCVTSIANFKQMIGLASIADATQDPPAFVPAQ